MSDKQIGFFAKKLSQFSTQSHCIDIHKLDDVCEDGKNEINFPSRNDRGGFLPMVNLAGVQNRRLRQKWQTGRGLTPM